MEHVLKSICITALAFSVSACNGTFSTGLSQNPKDAPEISGKSGKGENGARPTQRPSALNTSVPKPAKSAKTAEQFDTTTKQQRAEAVKEAAPETGEKKLGTTIGSLGDPTEPGFWLKTPLVSVAAKGRLEYPDTGKSVAVDLIPIEGPKTGGSRVSLAALRLLGASLTGLPELVVYRN